MPHNRHGLVPMLVAIRVAAERKRRKALAEAEGEAGKAKEEKPAKKKRGWFG